MDISTILIIAAAFFIGWKIQQRKKETVIKCLKKQAIKHNGSVKPVFLAYPRLFFGYHDTDVMVSAMSGGILASPSRSSQTCVSFYLPGCSDNWFDIRNKSQRNFFNQVFGSQHIQFENPEFEDRFTVRASDEAFIHTLLTREIQEKLLQFTAGKEPYVQFTKRALFKDGRPVFGEHQPSLYVSIRKILTDEGEYDQLIETALLFHDRLKSFA